jgi:uncharacterized protein
MDTLKFLICGPHQAGKTAFIASVAETFRPRRDYPETDQEPAQTALEFGTTKVNSALTYTFQSVSSPRRFDFLMEIVSEDCAGYVFIVDSTRSETFHECRTALEYLLNYHRAPFIVVANKQDLPGALAPDLVRQAFGLDQSAQVVHCIATSKESALAAFEVLLKLVMT